MKRIKKVISYYFNSVWLPSLLLTFFLSMMLISGFLNYFTIYYFFTIPWLFSFLGIFIAAIWSFIKKDFARGLFNLLLFSIVVIINFIIVGIAFYS